MTEFVIEIDKAKVYDDVGRIAAYVGSKSIEEADTYARVATTNYDSDLLDTFWQDACDAVTSIVRFFLLGDNAIDVSDDYVATLTMPSSWNSLVAGSINTTLHNFFVNLIAGKWFATLGKEASAGYSGTASGLLADAETKLYCRKKPQRSEISE